ADALSSSGPLVTITSRVPAGRSPATPAPVAKACQKPAQVAQPLERKATSVACGAPAIPTATASPVGPTPAMSWAAVPPAPGRGGATPGRVRRSGPAGPAGRPPAPSSYTPAPSS